MINSKRPHRMRPRDLQLCFAMHPVKSVCCSTASPLTQCCATRLCAWALTIALLAAALATDSVLVFTWPTIPARVIRYARAGPNRERMLVITRALLGHAHVHPSPPKRALAPPFLPSAPNNERYDSVVATPPGEFHEVIVFENAQMYPELVVYYTAN